ncbi:hypothetical protein AB0N09_43555, partial [Streptomyces erythrochromogenes]|uniref:DedA family protein n=1 Tax=Streptomyces erythrochromogenes TaxID=285574 RepID=UPI0034985890
MSADTSGAAGGIAGWATHLVETMGGPGAGIAIALENLFPPLPSEIILPLTGFAVGQGALSLASALIWTTAGSVIGALALYQVGRLFGRERMYALWGRLPLVKTAETLLPIRLRGEAEFESGEVAGVAAVEWPFVPP